MSPYWTMAACRTDHPRGATDIVLLDLMLPVMWWAHNLPTDVRTIKVKSWCSPLAMTTLIMSSWFLETGADDYVPQTNQTKSSAGLEFVRYYAAKTHAQYCFSRWRARRRPSVPRSTRSWKPRIRSVNFQVPFYHSLIVNWYFTVYAWQPWYISVTICANTTWHWVWRDRSDDRQQSRASKKNTGRRPHTSRKSLDHSR